MLSEQTADRLINMVSTTADLLEEEKKPPMIDHYRTKLTKELSEVEALDLSEAAKARFGNVQARCKKLLSMVATA